MACYGGTSDDSDAIKLARLAVVVEGSNDAIISRALEQQSHILEPLRDQPYAAALALWSEARIIRNSGNRLFWNLSLSHITIKRRDRNPGTNNGVRILCRRRPAI